MASHGSEYVALVDNSNPLGPEDVVSAAHSSSGKRSLRALLGELLPVETRQTKTIKMATASSAVRAVPYTIIIIKQEIPNRLNGTTEREGRRL